MLEISYLEMLVAISAIWIIVRAIACLHNGFEWKRELRLLLFYVCIIVIARFVFFPLHRIDGRIGTLIFDSTRLLPPWLNLRLFTFVHERYDGWLTNIIGNVAMFIPVGVILPICFGKLDNVLKVTLAGFGMSLFIELSQFLFYDRGTDVDDLLLNTVGTLIGATIYFIIIYIRNGRKKKAEGG